MRKIQILPAEIVKFLANVFIIWEQEWCLGNSKERRISQRITLETS